MTRKLPTAIKKARGTLQPCRTLNEPDALSIEDIEPPCDFDNVELATWNAVISELIESRVLGRQDLRALESYCISYALMKEARFHIQEDGITIVQANGNTVKNPATTVLNEAITRLNSIGGEFGLTPVSRSRVNVPKTKVKGNRFIEDL